MGQTSTLYNLIFEINGGHFYDFSHFDAWKCPKMLCAWFSDFQAIVAILATEKHLFGKGPKMFLWT